MEKTNSLSVPVVTLSNGLRVANFSSPHDFHFVDGSILPACSEERARVLMLDSEEVESKRWIGGADIKVIDIELKWKMSQAVEQALGELFHSEEFDVLIVPLPVMQAMKEQRMLLGKARCIRMADRVNKKSHIDRFCI